MTYTRLRARYSKGMLKLRQPLRLPEGAEVRVSVITAAKKTKPRKTSKRQYIYPTRTLSWKNVRQLSGLLSIGGDALADSEALYS